MGEPASVQPSVAHAFRDAESNDTGPFGSMSERPFALSSSVNLSGRHSKSFQARNDLEALLVRMRHRLYPETIPVLASYWLKSVYACGHKRGWWQELSELLEQALREELLNNPSREALIEIQTWIQREILSGKMPGAVPKRLQPFRSSLRPERLAPYIGRLLNQWLSAEIARLLVDESESAIPSEDGIPVLAVGRALERLLVRERLSPGSLEMLLQPELLSPEYVYPADAEILRDVVLALLGRTQAPKPLVMPAIVLSVAAGSSLPANYREAVHNASYVQRQGSEQIRVPIATAEALEILQGDPVRIGSIIVTTDGRWWESETLQSGDQYSVVYKPGGRLRIDYTGDHAKLEVPCPDTRLYWPGVVRFQDREIFGREWHVSSWETEGDRSWLHLVFSRALPIAEIAPTADSCFPRSRPASVDMAWAALENALVAAMFENSREPIEQLRRPEFIPLGRAIYGLAESMKDRRLLTHETIETQLRGIRYLQSEVSLQNGRVPWRILPARIQEGFLKRRSEPVFKELLKQVFDELPEEFRESPSSAPATGPTLPSQAA
jgi:hypothetical protein